MTNEQYYYHSHYHQALEGLQDGLTVEICNSFNNQQSVYELHELQEQFDIDFTSLHNETIRALCHYASIAAGELTDTTIEFRPNISRMVGEGYSQKKQLIHQFVVERRVSPLIQRRVNTYEKRPTEPPRHHTTHTSTSSRTHSKHIPGHVSRLINSRRDW